MNNLALSNLQSYRLEPKPSKKSFDAIIVSASVNLPDNVIVFSFPLLFNSSFILFKAVSQSAHLVYFHFLCILYLIFVLINHLSQILFYH